MKLRMTTLFLILLMASYGSKTFPVPQENLIFHADVQSNGKSQIVLLGTGTPNAEPDRSGPSVAIIVNGTPYLVDLGPGVVRRANAAFQSGIKALDLKNLKRAFITHLHSDHTLGYPDFILTPWVLGRSERPEVYGPPGIRAMTAHLLKAYEEDIHLRLQGDQPSNTAGYQINAHEIRPGIIYKDANVTVKAFSVRHGAWSHAFGYRFETPDRVIVLSGDTTPSPNVVENCHPCDVLIHEVYSQAGFEKRAPEWQRYHSRYHTSSVELAKMALQAKPGVIILYHQLLWGTTQDELLKEIRQIYDGTVVYGNDLEVY